MHYKLGVELKANELVFEDKLFGLIQKYFKSNYLIVKRGIPQELVSLACQIGDYLKLKDELIKAE